MMMTEVEVDSKLSVLLVGLGDIGFKYDLQNSLSDKPSLGISSFSHFGSALSAGHTVIGGIDLDKSSRELFNNLTSLPAWTDTDEVPINTSIDLIVISTPPITHKSVLDSILKKFHPRGVIIEKPFGVNAQESQEMLNLLSSKQIPLRVNYSRNFSNGFKEIKKVNLSNAKVTGLVKYSLGLRRNGSHFLRLVLELLGKPQSIEKHTSIVSVENPSFRLNYENGGSIQFIGSDSDFHRQGEMTFESGSHLISITEALQFEIKFLDLQTTPVPWPSQLVTVSSGTLNGGMSQLYSDLHWMTPSQFDANLEENALNLLTNRVIDEIL
jgi:hypothetical protein